MTKHISEKLATSNLIGYAIRKCAKIGSNCTEVEKAAKARMSKDSDYRLRRIITTATRPGTNRYWSDKALRITFNSIDRRVLWRVMKYRCSRDHSDHKGILSPYISTSLYIWVYMEEILSKKLLSSPLQQSLMR